MNVSLTLTTRPRESSAVQTDLMLTLCPVHCEPKLGPANLGQPFQGVFLGIQCRVGGEAQDCHKMLKVNFRAQEQR